MIKKDNIENWRIIQDTAIGTSHKRSGKPNQDRIEYFPKEPFKFPIILTAADGHGGKTYFRSGKGAELAIESALEICKELDKISWDEIKDKKIVDWICRDIVQIWIDKVEKDIQTNPFTEDETSILSLKKESSSKRPYGLNNDEGLFAYGSTLIIVVLHESYLLYLQVGDGDVLVINAEGQTDQPIPIDERLIGTETTSLCLPEAWSDFRFRLIPRNEDDQDPALIFVSTDGFKISFKEESGFEQFGIDLLNNLCENPNGIESEIKIIAENLAGWLNNISEGGVGDDTTMGIIFNKGQIKKYCDTKYREVLLKKVMTAEHPVIDVPGQTAPYTSEIPKNEDEILKETVEKSVTPIDPQDIRANQII